MKALIGSGLCLALACVSARAFAEELQWRSAVGAAGAKAPAGISPVSYTVPVSAPADPGIGLGRPLGASGSTSQETDLPEFRANGVSLERPSPLFRGQAPEAPMQPLPVGFPLRQESGKADAKGAATGAPPPAMPPRVPGNHIADAARDAGSNHS